MRSIHWLRTLIALFAAMRANLPVYAKRMAVASVLGVLTCTPRVRKA